MPRPATSLASGHRTVSNTPTQMRHRTNDVWCAAAGEGEALHKTLVAPPPHTWLGLLASHQPSCPLGVGPARSSRGSLFLCPPGILSVSRCPLCVGVRRAHPRGRWGAPFPLPQAAGTLSPIACTSLRAQHGAPLVLGTLCPWRAAGSLLGVAVLLRGPVRFCGASALGSGPRCSFGGRCVVSAVVGFGGGRVLPPARLAALGRLAVCVARAGALVRVGCASGADWAVVRALGAVAPARLVVFCAWPAGSSSAGARRARWAAARGARVVWCAGGPAPSVAAALARRSLALSRSGLSAFVAAPAPVSRGTWLAVRAARAAGVPVSGAFRVRRSAGVSGPLLRQPSGRSSA